MCPAGTVPLSYSPSPTCSLCVSNGLLSVFVWIFHNHLKFIVSKWTVPQIYLTVSLIASVYPDVQLRNLGVHLIPWDTPLSLSPPSLSFFLSLSLSLCVCICVATLGIELRALCKSLSYRFDFIFWDKHIVAQATSDLQSFCFSGDYSCLYVLLLCLLVLCWIVNPWPHIY